MLRVIGCITQDHDPKLVGMAMLVCVLTTLTSTRLLVRGRAGGRDTRLNWIVAAAATFALGVWTTHFLGLLAYLPDLPAHVDVPLSVISLAFIAVPAGVAFWLWSGGRRSWHVAAVSGVLIALGTAMMHFLGMRSLRLPATIRYDPPFVAAAVALAAAFATLAMGALNRSRLTLAALLLAASVSSLHFVAMAAVRLQPIAGIDVPALAIPRSILAIAVGAGCLMILGLAFAVFSWDRHLADQRAAEARRFRVLADATFEGLIFERGGRVVDVNRAMTRLMGASAAGLVGTSVTGLFCGENPLHISIASPAREYQLLLANGDRRPVEVLVRANQRPDQHVLAIRDITSEKTAQRQIERLVHSDLLTGVGNRRLLEETLGKYLALSDRTTFGLALLCIDLDRFKAVNDALGPSVGDQILIQAARRLVRTVRETDTVARVGGDEFAIVQVLAGQPDDAAALAERIVTELGLPYIVDGQSIMVGGSVGIALYPADGVTTLELMTNGALALSRAKRDGRNNWRYCEPGMDAVLRERRALEHDLRTALNDGQFFIAYQPFFDAATLRIAGYEALLRWDHPTRGPMSPADFIPIAEECGLIVPIGQWVLHTACAEAVGWDSPLVIAVNMSPAQLAQPGAVDGARTALRETALDPSRLELEITEGVLMGDTERALDTLTALKGLGVSLAMDDFGTGYSSLSYLKKFPFDKLKIDRSFIHDLEDGLDGEPIVQAIVALSKNLRLLVTAEGVETQAQLDLLRQTACTYVQGFLLGRPHTPPLRASRKAAQPPADTAPPLQPQDVHLVTIQ